MSHDNFRTKYRMFLTEIAAMPPSVRRRYEKLAADTLRRYEQRHGKLLLQELPTPIDRAA